MAKNPQLVIKVSQDFENKCITLLEESYYSLLAKKITNPDFEENDFTTLLNNEIYDSPLRSKFKIWPVREYYVFNSSLPLVKGFANKEARIDLMFHHYWGKGQELFFHVEAKRLDGSKKLFDRYISTGILNYLPSGKYHKLNGILMGYLVVNPIDLELPLLNIEITSQLDATQNICILGKTPSGIHNVYQSKHFYRNISHLFFEFFS